MHVERPWCEKSGEVGGDQERERWGWGKVEKVGSGGSVWRDRDADERS
jgi:hypothetical protein